MEKVKVVNPSRVGPLAEAEDSADRFISGIVYCSLIEKLIEQQAVVDKILDNSEHLTGTKEFDEAEADADALEKVWIHLGDSLGYEC